MATMQTGTICNIRGSYDDWRVIGKRFEITNLYPCIVTRNPSVLRENENKTLEILFVCSLPERNSRPNVILSTSAFQKDSSGHLRGTNVLESK